MSSDLLAFAKTLLATILWWLAEMGGQIVNALSHWTLFVGAAFVLACSFMASRFMRG